MAAFSLATAYGTYLLVRRWLGRTAAFATALLFIGIPGMGLWGRQVMLEIPATAFLIWSAYFFFSYVEKGEPRALYLTVAFLLAGAYTKQTILFVVPCYALTTLVVHGTRGLRRPEVWRATIFFAAGLLPLAAFTWTWGRVNVQQAVGGDWVQYSRRSVGGWIYVARQLPNQLGWAVLTLALLYGVSLVLWKSRRLPRPALCLSVMWLAVGYLFFTLIALKEPRHSVLLAFPFVLFAIAALVELTPRDLGPYLAAALAVGVFAHTLISDRVPYVSGYRAAAQYVCSIAPPDSVVLFSGMRDGSFIFNVRSIPECKNLTVIRSDKLLLRVAVDREKFGVKELGVDESRFKDMLQQYGVRYVVLEPNFWNDLQSMQMLVRVIHENQFKLLTTVPCHEQPQPQR